VGDGCSCLGGDLKPEKGRKEITTPLRIRGRDERRGIREFAREERRHLSLPPRHAGRLSSPEKKAAIINKGGTGTLREG